MRSKPALDFVHHDRRLGQLAAGAPRQTTFDSQGRPGSVAGSLEAARRAHRDDHAYPPGLLEAIDGRLSGRPSPDPAMRELADQILAQAA